MASDRSDFDRLVRDHARVMAAAIRRVCGRHHGALIPDVQQEVYLALWKRLEGGKAIDHPISYLYKVALTTALAMVRKLRDAPDTATPDGNPPASERSGGLHPLERARLIEEVLGTLEPDDARALRAWLAGFNHKEVARLHGWTESVARHRVYRSLERLRGRTIARE